MSTAEVPVWLDNRELWVSGVCRKTTCSDVIAAVLGGQEACNGANYAIMERWRRVERQLDGSAKILRVWNQWGDAQTEVRLMVRKIDPDADSGRGSPSSPSSRHQRHHGHHRQRRRGQGDAVHPKRLAAAAAAAAAAVATTSTATTNAAVCDHPSSPVSADISRLLKLILAQGETIQSQLRRLRDREDEILGMEHATHRERQQQLGSNYLLETYLRDLDCEKEDSGVVTSSPIEDEPGMLLTSNEQSSSPDIAEAIELFERLVKLNKRLEREEETLVRLYAKLRRCHNEPEMDAVTELRHQLVEVDAALEAGAQEASEAERQLEDAEMLLQERLKKLERLQAEVDAAEAEILVECIPPPEEFQSPPNTSSETTTKTTDNQMLLLLSSVPNPSYSYHPTQQENNHLHHHHPHLHHFNTNQNQCNYYNYHNPSSFYYKQDNNNLYYNHEAPPKPQRHPSSTMTNATSGGQKPPDIDSNSDTGLSSLHSSSEEGVYVLDTLV